MAFTAEQKSIYDLFTRKKYLVPRNQRRYVWDKRNWEELFDDIYSSIGKKTPHFIGSFVLKDEGRDEGIPTFTIIDGQQRIITLTILLSSISYWLKIENMMDDFEGTKQYLYALNEKAKQTQVICLDYHLSLGRILEIIDVTDRDDLLKLSINKILNDGTVSSSNDKQIIAAYKFFLNRIKELQETEGFIQNLINLREAVINTSYISIISTTEEDSYTIFEILNARGIELESHELLKNYIMRYIEPEYKRDEAKQVWVEMEMLLGKNFKKFIKHYTTHKCKDRIQGLSDYKRLQRVYKGNNTKSLLYDLKKKSEYYCKMINPSNYCNQDSEEFQVFSFFKKKRQEQLRPLLLSIIHKKEEEIISESEYGKILRFLYNFYVCYNIIGEENSNKLTNVVYKYAAAIENNYSDDIIQRFIEELKNKLPNEDQFKNAFKNVGYSKFGNFYEGDKNKDRVQTVLEVLEKHLNSNFCFPNFTIEHILDDSSDPIKNGQIGNLLPLENSKNSKCNGKSLEEKLQIYEDSIYKTTRSFSKRFREKEFDPSVRTNYLASLFYKEILNFD